MSDFAHSVMVAYVFVAGLLWGRARTRMEGTPIGWYIVEVLCCMAWPLITLYFLLRRLVKS